MSDFKIIETQEELDRIIGEQLSIEKAKYADYDELKQKVSNFDVIESRVKELEIENSNLQSAIDEHNNSVEGYKSQISEFENKISSYEMEKLKVNIALKNGLPIDLANRLQGGDEKELLEDAERLAGFMKPKQYVTPLKSTEKTIDTADASYKALVSNLNIED